VRENSTPRILLATVFTTAFGPVFGPAFTTVFAPGFTPGFTTVFASVLGTLGLMGCESEAAKVPEGSRALIVAAASSLGPVMEEAVALWSESTGRKAEVVIGASSTLARQIQNGAPFDLFVTAHASWMDVLVAEGLVEEGEPAALAGNGLVVIESARDGGQGRAGTRPWGAEVFAAGRWALGDPAHVPAGVYARQAVESVGAWSTLEPRVIPTASVRAALRLVQLREVDFGIVYRTDALGSGDVTIVVTVPAQAHAAATVIAARLKAAQGGAEELLDWIAGPEVRALLGQRGFVIEER
jgi:molybdate transport system substrate-binding protein